MPVQTGMALSAWSNGTDDNPLSDGITRYTGPERRDHADGFVSYDAARGNGVLPLQNVNVGSADRGRGHLDQCVTGTNTRYGSFVKNDPARFDKYRCFHGSQGGLPSSY